MQHAAMGGVDGRCAYAGQPRQPGVKPALGAMAMHDVDRKRACQPAHGQRRGQVPSSEQAGHGEAMDAEPGMGGEAGQFLLGLGVVGNGVDHQPHLVAAGGQHAGEIGHMAEQPAHRRPHDLQDAQAGFGHGSEPAFEDDHGVARIDRDIEIDRAPDHFLALAAIEDGAVAVGRVGEAA